MVFKGLFKICRGEEAWISDHKQEIVWNVKFNDQTDKEKVKTIMKKAKGVEKVDFRTDSMGGKVIVVGTGVDIVGITDTLTKKIGDADLDRIRILREKETKAEEKVEVEAEPEAEEPGIELDKYHQLHSEYMQWYQEYDESLQRAACYRREHSDDHGCSII